MEIKMETMYLRAYAPPASARGDGKLVGHFENGSGEGILPLISTNRGLLRHIITITQPNYIYFLTFQTFDLYQRQ